MRLQEEKSRLNFRWFDECNRNTTVLLQVLPIDNEKLLAKNV